MEGMDRDNTIVSDNFAGDLDFGVQQTLTMGSNDLMNFLTSDPKDITPIDKSSTTTTAETTKDVKVNTEEEDPTKKAKSELESFLSKKEEEPAETTEEPTKPETTEGEDNEETNPYSIIAKELYEAGILTKDEDEDDVDIIDGESLLEKFQQDKRKGAIEIIDNFLSRFGEDYKEAFDAIYVKGVDPREYFQTQSSIQNFKEMDITDEENQKKIFVEFHKQLGLTDEQIQKRLQKAIDYADLEEDAKTFHEKLIEKETKRLEELEQKKETERQSQIKADQEYNQSLQRILQEKVTAKEFDGIPVTPKLAGDTYSFMYHKKYRTPSGEELTEFDKFLLDLKKPENYELRVKIGLLAQNKFDLSKVKQVQDSKEKSKAFAALDKTKITRQARQEVAKPQVKSFFD